MKKIGKALLWILGIIAWFFLLMTFWMADLTHGTSSHLLILTITGICLAIYIWKKSDSKTRKLEEENQKLQQELADQAVQRAMDRAENREKKG